MATIADKRLVSVVDAGDEEFFGKLAYILEFADGDASRSVTR